MVNFRTFFYTLIIICTPSLVFAGSTTIASLKSVEEKVSSLRKQGIKSKNILVVWDFHGVVTVQKSHKDDLTLNNNILPVLDYLKKRKVPNIIATAWNNFNAVARGVTALGLAPYFDVEPDEKPLEKVKLGQKSAIALEGYKNGKVVALRKPDDFSQYFRRKAFASEWCFPNRDFEHIIFVDDSRQNTDAFSKDFKKTIYYDEKNKKKLTLYYFDPSQDKPEIKSHQQHKRSSSASGEYGEW